MSIDNKRKKNILVTGGAGFIGSNLVSYLVQHPQVNKVRVLDNLITGFKSNLDEFFHLENFEFIEGDIRDFATCMEATQGMDLISHQAALGSVPRSIEDPLTSNDVNINGSLNIFHAAVRHKVERVVFAASSSTYGDSPSLPKVEHIIGKPLSPYAVTKFVNELYADVFSKTYDFNYIGLRYFNVFGPKQDPNGAYAAVIPIFMKAALENKSPYINGDGKYSRDFTFIENVIQANILSLFSENQEALNQIYNIAYGSRTTLNDLWTNIKSISKTSSEAVHRDFRSGDIPHSHADISKANNLLNYQPSVNVKQGLEIAFNWYLEKSQK